jgi:hypothetical protein
MIIFAFVRQNYSSRLHRAPDVPDVQNENFLTNNPGHIHLLLSARIYNGWESSSS